MLEMINSKMPEMKMKFEYAASDSMRVHLGIRNEYRFLVERLNVSLYSTYMENVKSRVIKLHQMNEIEYEWNLIELKRFFIMALIFKSVPMYSSDADVIWHEMLMFTREYQEFCQRFAGGMIHHAPNVGGIEVSELESSIQRGWYEVFYQDMFEIKEENIVLLGDFGNGKLGKKMIIDFVENKEYVDTFFSGYRTEVNHPVKELIYFRIKNKFKNSPLLK